HPGQKEPGCREHGEPFLEQVELQLLVGEPKLLNGDVGANERNDHGRECPEDVQPPWCAVEPPRGHRARGVARRRDDSTCGRRPPWAEYGGAAGRGPGEGGGAAPAPRPRGGGEGAARRHTRRRERGGGGGVTG